MAAEELRLATIPSEKEAYEEHLASCESCRRALLEAKELSSVLESSLAAYAHGAGECARRIADALPAQRVGVSYWRSRVFRLDAAAAALLFGLGLFVGWLFQGGSPESSPTLVERKPAMAAPLVPQVIDTRARTAHELLPSDRVRTSGQRQFIIVIPNQPGVIIQVDHQSELEDSLPLPPPGVGEKEVPVE